MKTFSIQEINTLLNGILVGSTTHQITAPEQLEMASETEISFIGNRKYEKLWLNSKACAAIVNEDITIEPGDNVTSIGIICATITCF
jgi:UDP-3-O-[3-hydroxymyristoyl] glucosamine N-acyltransferase